MSLNIPSEKSRAQLKKSKNKKQPPTVLIICKNKKSAEYKYFQSLSFKCVNKIVKPAREKISNIDYLIKESIYYKKQYEINERYGDRTWCIFNTQDINNKLQNLDQTLDRAKKNKIRLGIFNPCFELWYYLHFAEKENIQNNLDYEIHKFIQNHNESYNDFNTLNNTVDKAISNCKLIQSLHENSSEIILPHSEIECSNIIADNFINITPYTNIHILLEYLQSINN